MFAQEPQRVAGWVRIAALDGVGAVLNCATAGCCSREPVYSGIKRLPLTWFSRAAAAGDIDAVNMVGRCFDNGWGAAENPATAAVHYRIAAEAGHSWAQYNLGHLYLDGRGVRRGLRYSVFLLPPRGRAATRARDEPGRAMLRAGVGNAARSCRGADMVSAFRRGGLFSRSVQLGRRLLLEAGRLDEAAEWFELAARGGTAAVRVAVMDAIAGADAHGALRELAARLFAGRPFRGV